jgi:hypothetical protein
MFVLIIYSHSMPITTMYIIKSLGHQWGGIFKELIADLHVTIKEAIFCRCKSLSELEV